MKSAVATRFRCSSPPTDLEQLTPMLDTLILQYLNKLVERKVRDFTSPKSFHTRKVQGFNRNRIKLLTEFRGKLPLKIFALVADFPIETCDVSHTSPPPVRTFSLTAKCLVERPKLLQVRFQGLGVLFFLTRAQCQICVFHAEVCPNALTCCRQKFRFYKVCNYVKPIITTGITLDYDMTDISIKLTVFMKCISNFIIAPFTFFPFAEVQRDTIVFQRSTRLLKHKRFKLVAGFPSRFTTQFLEKTDISSVNPSKFFLDGLTRQCFPMRMCRPFQIGKVGRHGVIVRIRQPVFISFVLPPVKIVMHLPYIVKQIADTDTIGLIAKLILIRFHGLSSFQFLTPTQWVGRHVTKR